MPAPADAASAIAFNDPALLPLDTLASGDTLCFNLDAVSSLPAPPESLRAAKGRDDYKLWLAAAQKEVIKKRANGTIKELVDRSSLPAGTNIVKSRYRFVYKWDHDTGCLDDEKGYYCRWVACGYSQRFGVDYWQTYTATTKAAGIRMFAAEISRLDLDTEHIDVEKAFTSTNLTETVYCEQPEEMVEGGYLPDGRPRKVALLAKGLEGLKQSGNGFQVTNVSHLTGPCGMTQSDSEPTLFTRHFKIDGEPVVLLLLVWVDDIWCAFSRGGKERILMPFLKTYKERYPIKMLGPIKRFVGIDITRDREAGTITLSQETFIASMVPKYVHSSELSGITVKAPASVLDKYERKDTYSDLALATDPIEIAKGSKYPFLSAIASCLYATCFTRPDCAFNVSILSQFSSSPSVAA